jgi:hypothetical protein
MAKVIGPLFAIRASGTYNKFLTYVDKVKPWMCEGRPVMGKITREGREISPEIVSGRKALWNELPVGQVNYLKRMTKKKKEDLPSSQQEQIDKFQQALEKWRSLTFSQKAMWLAYCDTCHFAEWMGFALEKITEGEEIPDEPPE